MKQPKKTFPSSSNEVPAKRQDEVKLPEGTVTTTLGRGDDKKHSVVYTSATGPLRSVYVSRDAFEEMPPSITFHMVPNG